MIRLRLLQEQDLVTRVVWLNTPSLVKNMSIQGEITLQGTQQWYERVCKIPNRYDVVLEENGELMAMGGLTNFIKGTRSVESYLFVNPQAQSKGHGTLILHQMVGFAFSKLGYNSVFAYVMPTNTPSMRVHRKVGFQIVDNSSRQLFPIVKENRDVLQVSPKSYRVQAVSPSIIQTLENLLP